MRGALLVGLALAFAALGCARVEPQQQRWVAKPNMTFSESLVFAYSFKLLPQVEPGSAFCGGAQSAGCASCK
jgi:hypothetical protein